MNRAQRQDREAFETLVERHAAGMYRIAAAIVGREDAADVTQEAFVAAWQQLHNLRDDGAFESWLRRICVNRSRNWLRSRKRRPLAALDLVAMDMAEGRTDHRADFSGALEARMILEPAFDSLTPDQRAVLALHYSMGLSIGETADALAIRVGTAKSRLSAGLSTLRRAIDRPLAEGKPEVVS